MMSITRSTNGTFSLNHANAWVFLPDKQRQEYAKRFCVQIGGLRILRSMKEERDGIYKNSSIKPVIVGFLAIILVALVLGLVFLRSGHPIMHTHPQPANNKGALALPQVGHVA